MRILSFGLVGRRAVFMDERSDSYFMIDEAIEEHLHCLLEGGIPLGRDPTLLEALGAADEPLDVRQADHPRPSNSLLDRTDAPRVRARDVIRTAHLLIQTRSRLRRQPIDKVLMEAFRTADPEPSALPALPDMIRSTGRYFSARRFVPVGRNCLLDCLCLLRWLGSQANGVALVFGVKLDPFAAHCWIQSGDLLLSDRVETVQSFTPVRVIQCSEAMA